LSRLCPAVFYYADTVDIRRLSVIAPPPALAANRINQTDKFGADSLTVFGKGDSLLGEHQFFEPLRCVQLIDYKVRVLDASQGTGAKVRVHIMQTDGEESWTTVGVSENILEASYKALADGVRYKLLKVQNPQSFSK